jgi:broad specificity phosphatase PhoE
MQLSKTIPVLHFVRHGEHKKVTQDRWELTPTGLKEAELVAKKLHHIKFYPTVQTAIYCTATFQALQTATSIKKTTNLGRVIVSDMCDYFPSGNNTRFANDLKDAIPNSVFEFLARESDNYQSENDTAPISSRANSYQRLSMLIEKFVRNKPRDRIFVLKEHLYSLFRSEHILQNYGSNKFNEYIEWYKKNVENKDVSRTDVNSIFLCEDNSIRIKYGFTDYL